MAEFENRQELKNIKESYAGYAGSDDDQGKESRVCDWIDDTGKKEGICRDAE